MQRSQWPEYFSSEWPWIKFACILVIAAIVCGWWTHLPWMWIWTYIIFSAMLVAFLVCIREIERLRNRIKELEGQMPIVKELQNRMDTLEEGKTTEKSYLV